MTTETRDLKAAKPSGRVVTRWVAEDCGTTPRCGWNERKDPKRHLTSDAAVREARDHAVEAGHVRAREVQVRRLFKPRELASEEIVQ